MSDLSLRRAVADESDVIADLIFGNPDDLGRRVLTAVYGARDGEQLRPLFRRFAQESESWRCTTFAIDTSGEVVGLIQTATSPLRITPKLILSALWNLRTAAVRLPWRLRLFDAVTPTKPVDAFVVAEIHVRADRRGQGVGTFLLDHAETLARQHGASEIALDTYTSNPARHLYERAGYACVTTTSNRRFERLSGVSGRALYVKRLHQDS